MNAIVNLQSRPDPSIDDAVALACSRIAPSWPLDRAIAVNPHWGWIDQPIDAAAARLGVLAGMRLLPGHSVERHPLVADLAGHRDLVVHQVSQHCAAYFDAGQARWHMPLEPDAACLYQGWLERLAADRGIPWPQGRRAALATLGGLPRAAMPAIEHSLTRLGVPRSAWADCLTAWLLDLNGWSAACAWQRWQARLGGGDDARIVELLAMRAAWDALLADALPATRVEGWARSWTTVDAAVTRERERQQHGWSRLETAERLFQAELIASMSAPASPGPDAPSVQAVFCIDVRSEVFRRALEATDPSIATRGFAGFFGLPIDHQPLGTNWRQPQLPGLLAPSITASESTVEPGIAERRRSRLAASSSWASWAGTPASAFSFVEACGVLYAGSLLRSSLAKARGPSDWASAGLKPGEIESVSPRLGLSVDAAADLAHGVLGAMGLIEGYAPLVLICGHGAQTANNAHAATLDCGACGGRSGEVNARALVHLLNDPEVRAGLAARGRAIPDGTCFIAGLHNTTTDEVTLYDPGRLPPSHAQAVETLRNALKFAGDRARAERAPGLGLPALDARALLERMRERTAHWAETRPEWALADNAGFVAAPRSRTRQANLGGRVFLHDYDHRLDPGHQVLTLILTAPVIVAHWINLQYLASTVDPERHGAGNKLLHNVVGGGIGVFEGNGGDLRIGLPWQSVHDGERERHTPRRLSVFVEAPRAAIDSVIAGHADLRRLVEHGWLHLIAIEGEAIPKFLWRVPGGRWVSANR